MLIETGNTFFDLWYNIPLLYLVLKFWGKVFKHIDNFIINLHKRYKAHKHFKNNTEQYQEWGKRFDEAMKYAHQNYAKGNEEGGKAWEKMADKNNEKRRLCRIASYRWWVVDEKYWVF